MVLERLGRNLGAGRGVEDEQPRHGDSGIQPLTAGAVHVNWGANEGADEVWLGTGEALPSGPRDLGFVGNYGGIGVLHAVGPVATVRANPLADPWGTAQAQQRPAAGRESRLRRPRRAGNLPGARQPGAASRPARRHDCGPAPARPGRGRRDRSVVPGSVPAWDAALAGASARLAVTDVAWTPATGAHGARIWATVVDQVGAGLTGLWLSTDNGVTFAAVALPGMPAAPQRFAIGWHPNHADTLYVLTSGPNLWRIDGTLAPPGAGPQVVANVPTTLFWNAGSDISFYAIAAGVDPANSARVIVGGAAVTSPIDAATAPSASFAAAMYLLTVSPAGAPGTDRH